MHHPKPTELQNNKFKAMIKKGRLFDYSKIPNSVMVQHLKKIEELYENKKATLNPKCS